MTCAIATTRDSRDRDPDEQRVPEVEAGHRCERVVEASERVRAQVDLRAVRDGVDEPEAREPRRRNRIEEVDRERNPRGGDERVADEREVLAVPAVQPHEEGGCAEEVQRDVGRAEKRGQAGKRMGGVLDGALAEQVEVALERDDLVRVCPRGGKRGVALPAHDLVDPVKA